MEKTIVLPEKFRLKIVCLATKAVVWKYKRGPVSEKMAIEKGTRKQDSSLALT
jgi:hypothetical protein